MLTLLFAPAAFAGDFVDVWVTTALEDTNLLAGPEATDPSPTVNFVERGNRTFFEDYETRSSDDISQGDLVLYRADEGFFENWSTETALVLRYIPYLDPDNTDPGVTIEDDGSYVRLIRNLSGEDHTLSVTGYAVDANRFRTGYSYDLTWGGTDMFVGSIGAAPGLRLQWQRGGTYAFGGAKSAIMDSVVEGVDGRRNATYLGALAGAGTEIADGRMKIEAGWGNFQQGQILNTPDASSALYGTIITAMGAAGQVAFRTRDDLSWIESADLRLYRNAPEFVKDTYISHTTLDGSGVLVQAEIDTLWHNLLDDTAAKTVIETGIAGDLQSLLVINNTSLGVDLVYKDLAYIQFNVPGYSSGAAIPDAVTTTPQIYGRFKASHYFEDKHLAPSLGIGIMQPATSTFEGRTLIHETAYDIEALPDKQLVTPILGSIVGAQLDLSKSMVFVAEGLYTLNNNLSYYEQSNEEGTIGERKLRPANERNQLGVNVMMRARF